MLSAHLEELRDSLTRAPPTNEPARSLALLIASRWVADRLHDTVADDVLTVVWHSVTRLYWPAEETSAVGQAVDAARGRMPVAHVALEHDWSSRPGSADPRTPLLELDGEVLGVGYHHGPPVRLS